MLIISAHKNVCKVKICVYAREKLCTHAKICVRAQKIMHTREKLCTRAIICVRAQKILHTRKKMLTQSFE